MGAVTYHALLSLSSFPGKECCWNSIICTVELGVEICFQVIKILLFPSYHLINYEGWFVWEDDRLEAEGIRDGLIMV